MIIISQNEVIKFTLFENPKNNLEQDIKTDEKSQ